MAIRLAAARWFVISHGMAKPGRQEAKPSIVERNAHRAHGHLRLTELSDPRVDTLRLFRNGCFHYQRDYQKFAPFLSGDLESFDWAERLQMQFGAYFAKHPAQQSAGSHRAGEV
ncbi:MAG: hypothetical protein WBE89_03495 [Methyloceanibacter sp.]